MLTWRYQIDQQRWITDFLDLQMAVNEKAMEDKIILLQGALEPTLENYEWTIRQLQDPAIWCSGEVTYL